MVARAVAFYRRVATSVSTFGRLSTLRSGIVVVRASPAMVCSWWHDDLASPISRVANRAYSNSPDARFCMDCAL